MMPNKNRKRLGKVSGTRGEPIAPTARPANHWSHRVGPTPETAAKLQPDFLDRLLRDGPENGGIDNTTFEALFEIEEAHAVVGKLTSARSSTLELAGGGDPGNMSDGEARTWTVWLEWAKEFYSQTGVTGSKIAELIEMRHPVDPVFVGHYRRAAGLWDKAKRDVDKELDNRR